VTVLVAVSGLQYDTVTEGSAVDFLVATNAIKILPSASVALTSIEDEMMYTRFGGVGEYVQYSALFGSTSFPTHSSISTY